MRRAALILALGLLALVFGSTAPARATDANPGYELFATVNGTTFLTVEFKSVPLKTFDFGAGPVKVGDADTIIQRTQKVWSPSGTTNVTVKALQLRTTKPVAAGTFGPGTKAGFYFLTLDPNKNSTGTQTINFADAGKKHGGTYDSSFDLNLALRFKGLKGNIVDTFAVTVASKGNTWSNQPPAGMPLINGINSNLNGKDDAADFFPTGNVNAGGGGANDKMKDAGTPEPSGMAVAGIGFAGLGLSLARRARKAA